MRTGPFRRLFLITHKEGDGGITSPLPLWQYQIAGSKNTSLSSVPWRQRERWPDLWAFCTEFQQHGYECELEHFGGYFL
nr:MAG TPA: hypothetical protein [Caudoviricetes sp.]